MEWYGDEMQELLTEALSDDEFVYPWYGWTIHYDYTDRTCVRVTQDPKLSVWKYRVDVYYKRNGIVNEDDENECVANGEIEEQDEFFFSEE